jgi:hypothetical protein
MHRSACAVFVSTLILALSGTLSAAIVEITGVPNYSYYEGCGPTAGGMIIGYWDAHGGPNLPVQFRNPGGVPLEAEDEERPLSFQTREQSGIVFIEQHDQPA